MSKVRVYNHRKRLVSDIINKREVFESKGQRYIFLRKGIRLFGDNFIKIYQTGLFIIFKSMETGEDRPILYTDSYVGMEKVILEMTEEEWVQWTFRSATKKRK